jgi:hypothetical protein
MKNIKWSKFLKEAGVLFMVTTMILSTIAVTAHTNMNKNILQRDTTPVKENRRNILDSTKANTEIKTTQFGDYGGSRWHEGSTLSRTQGRAYTIQEINGPDGKSDDFRFENCNSSIY